MEDDDKMPEIPDWGFITASSNEAYIISGGCCGGGLSVVHGGKQFVWPWCQKVQWISLNSWGEVPLVSRNVYTRQGVPVTVKATAVMQIRTLNDDVPTPYRHRAPQPGPPHPTALMLLLDLGPDQGLSRADTRQAMINMATQTLEGHQRGFLGSVTMEQLFRDESRETANARPPNELIRDEVLRHAEPDLLRLGVKLVSYTIRSIDDEYGYLEALGQARTADVHAQSRIGEERHRKDELISEAERDAETAKSEYSSQIGEARARAERRTRVAENQIEEQTAKASEDLSNNLQMAKSQQAITAAKLQRELIEKVKDVASAEQEILRTSRTLEAQVSRPAASQARVVEEQARGQRTLTEMRARGESESLQISAAGEAEAIAAKGQAHADVINEKAISYNQYKGSALIDIVLRDLPKVAAEIAAPLARINSISMVSRGGGPAGHSRLADEVSEIMNMIPSALSDMTGIDIVKSIETAANTETQEGDGDGTEV
eukprot:m.63963 g.63963  ORF g.63963 m.63963 type:complete len:489 (-) comp8190_c0_seq1:128-1594(-)